MDDVFFAKKSTFSTNLIFFANYEIKHPSYGNECNFDKARALLHPNLLKDNFSQHIFMIKGLIW
jgi:hypothetical protein